MGYAYPVGEVPVNTKNIKLTMRRSPLETGASFFSDPFSLNGPVPGSSYAGVCMQFATGDPAVAEIAMSGAIRTRFLVPPELGKSSGAAELVMAPVAVNEAMAHRVQATKLRQGPWGPTPLFLDALEVPYGTAANRVSREIKYLAAKPATVQEARAQGKTKTETKKIDESSHPPGILTKPLKGIEFVFKRGRLLGLKDTSPAKSSPGAGPVTEAIEAKEKGVRPRRAPSGPAPGIWDWALR